MQKETLTRTQVEQAIKDREAIMDELRTKLPPELEAEQRTIREKIRLYRDSIEPELERLRTEIGELRNQKRAIQKEKDDKIPEEIRLWFNGRIGRQGPGGAEIQSYVRGYDSGYDFGSGGLEIRKVFPGNRYVLICNKGASVGWGTPMGSHGAYYAATSFWLADTTRGTYSEGNKFAEIKGRLFKEISTMYENIVKHLTEDETYPRHPSLRHYFPEAFVRSEERYHEYTTYDLISRQKSY